EGREERPAAQVVPLEEARIEDDPGRIDVAPAYLHVGRVLDHRRGSYRALAICSRGPRAGTTSGRRQPGDSACSISSRCSRRCSARRRLSGLPAAAFFASSSSDSEATAWAAGRAPAAAGAGAARRGGAASAIGFAESLIHSTLPPSIWGTEAPRFSCSLSRTI